MRGSRRIFARLIEHVRKGLTRYDAGELDAFELDDLIHHCKRSTQKLWIFYTGDGTHVYTTARTLEWLREQGELPDWWRPPRLRPARPLPPHPLGTRRMSVERYPAGC